MGNVIELCNIKDEILKLIPEYTSFLSELVKIPSEYGQERTAQLVVKNKMEELGLDVKTLYSRDDDESLNLVAQ